MVGGRPGHTSNAQFGAGASGRPRAVDGPSRPGGRDSGRRGDECAALGTARLAQSLALQGPGVTPEATYRPVPRFIQHLPTEHVQGASCSGQDPADRHRAPSCLLGAWGHLSSRTGSGPIATCSPSATPAPTSGLRVPRKALRWLLPLLHLPSAYCMQPLAGAGDRSVAVTEAPAPGAPPTLPARPPRGAGVVAVRLAITGQ